MICQINRVKQYFLILCVIILSGCSSGGDCKGCTTTTASDTPSISLTAPNTYPAGVPLTVWLTIVNTSSVNAANLSYSVPNSGNPGNNIGVSVDVTNGAVACPSLASGESCVFAAVIPAGSVPGSFTVTASGTSSGNVLHNAFNKFKMSIGIIPKFTTTTDVNIGLVDIPQNSHSLFVLPVTQTLNFNDSNTTTTMFSVLVESGAPSSITLQDANGSNITTATLISPPPAGGVYAVNDVATFSVTYPAGQSDNESVQAVTNLCSSNCSNMAQVLFVESGAGILSLDPAYVIMSPSYTTQIYTITNTGQTVLSNITLPSSSLPESFSLVSTCGNALAVGASCTFTITYTPGYASGIAPLDISYSNGVSSTTQTVTFTIQYKGLPGYTNIIIESATLNPMAESGIGSADSRFWIESVSPSTQQLTLKYVNNGNINAESFVVESALLSTGYSIASNNCNGILLESMANTNCTVVLNVRTTVAESQDLSLESASIYASWNTLDQAVESSFESQPISWYNQANNNESQNIVYLSVYNTPLVNAYLSSESGANPVPAESVMIESQFYLYYTLTGGYPGQTFTYNPILPAGMESSSQSCSLTTGSVLKCIIDIDTGSNSHSGVINYGGASDGVTPQPESAFITVIYPGVLIISAFAESPIYTGESTYAVVSLSGSANLTTPITVNIINNNSLLVSASPAACSLSSFNESCVVSLTGLESGVATFSAVASGYQTQISSGLTVIETIYAYFTNGRNQDINMNSYVQCRTNNAGIIESATCFGITPTGNGALSIPIGVVVDNTNRFIYNLNSNDPGNSYTQCKVNGLGIESDMCETITPTGAGALDSPQYIALDTLNHFVYMTNAGNGSVTQCAVGINGVESSSCTAVIAAGVLGFPMGIAVDTANQMVYIVDGGNSNFVQCPISGSGIDSANCASLGSVGSFAVGVAVDSINQFIYVGNGFSSYTQCPIGGSGINTAGCSTVTPTGVGAMSAPAGVAVNNGIVTFSNNNTPPTASYTQCTTGVSGIDSSSCLTTIPTGVGTLNVPYGIAFGR